jgi:SAM-dependent methyltransferase
MLERVVRLTACPECRGDLTRLLPRRKTGGRISRAELRCRECGADWWVDRGVGRFGLRGRGDTRKETPHRPERPGEASVPLGGIPSRELLEAHERTLSSVLESLSHWSGALLVLPARDRSLLQRVADPTNFRQLLIGVDPEVERLLPLEAFLRKVRRYARVSLAEAQADRLPFRASMANGVISVGGINELPRARDWIEEVARVLRPGAPVLLSGWITEEGSLTVEQAARSHLDEAITEPRLRGILRRAHLALESITLVAQGSRWPRTVGPGLPLEGDPWAQLIVAAHRERTALDPPRWGEPGSSPSVAGGELPGWLPVSPSVPVGSAGRPVSPGVEAKLPEAIRPPRR